MSLDARAFKGLSRFLAPSAGGPLADRALAEQLITPEQLQACIDEQDRSSKPLDEILVERGFLKAEDVVRLKAPALPPEVGKAALDPANLLGHYVLVRRAGVGGMAEVWKAWDRSLGRWVAVKFLKKEVGHPEQRLQREAQMAARLSHPAILAVHERGVHDGRHYLVLPFVDGQPPQPPLPPREAARIALEIAGGLDHAHRHGVIHRDVKPANILIDEGGRALLADFGLAIPGGAQSSRWALSGTPEYASPEQVRGDVLDARTDVYSLGATLFHFVTGKPPFSGNGPDDIGRQVLQAPPPPLNKAPRRLAAAIRRAMERDRNRRYRTVAELARDLQAYLQSSSPLRTALKSLAAVVAAGLLPWLVAYFIEGRNEEAYFRQELQKPLTEAREELAFAERLLVDSESTPSAVRNAALRAVPLYQEALALAGGDLPDAALGLARCQEILGRDDDAEAAYRRLRHLPEARLGAARLALRRHFSGRSETDWRAAAAKDLAHAVTGKFDDPSPVFRAYCEGRPAEALAEGEKIAERHRHDDVFLLTLGLSALETGRMDEALRRLDQATRLRPRDAAGHYYRGLALEKKGDDSGARQAFREALAWAPAGWAFYVEARKRAGN